MNTHSDSVHELVGDNPVLALHLLSVDSESKILRHNAVLVNQLNTRLLKALAELAQLGVVIELGAVKQTTRPREYGRNRVGGRLTTLLPLAVVARNRAMCSLGFHNLTVRRDELGGHHAQRAEALCENVRLNITVVVFARPDKAARGFDGLRNHVVNEAVLVVDSCLLKGLGIVTSKGSE
jgi:hypothetical protein